MVKLLKALRSIDLKNGGGSNSDLIIPISHVYLNLILYWTNTAKILATLITCLLPLFLILPQILYFVANSNNLDDAIECACPVAACILTNIKLILCYAKRENLKKLIDSLQFEWNENSKLQDPYVQRILKSTKIFCYRLGLVYGIWFIMVCVIYSMFPLGQHIYFSVTHTHPDNYSIPLPYKALYPYDINANYNFELSYIFIMAGVYILALSLSGFDTMFITLAYHVSVLFSLLNYRIMNIREHLKEKNTLNIVKSTAELKRCIMRNNNCIQFVAALEDNFNIYLMMQSVSSSIILCIVSFQLITNLGVNANTVKLVGYLFGSISQLFIFCWVSEKIKNEAENISQTVYFLPWYMGSINVQNTIRLMMLRAQKPLTVTAGKFYMISLESFKSIMITSYSYFTLLQTLANKN